MPIFNGNIKVKLSGIKDAYFGTVKIYASVVPVTITYSTEHGTAPASKVVNSGYVLTEDDLPTLTDSGYKFLGWDVSAGTVVTSDMTITAAWAARELVSIELSNPITSIDRKEAFDFGGTVTATFDNGTTEDVTSSTTFSGYDMSVSGTYDVVASYTSGEVTKSSTYSLTVNKIWETLWSGTLSSKVSYSSTTVTSSKEEVELTKNIPTRVTWSWTPPSGTIYYSKFPPDSWWGDYTTTKEETFSGTPEWTSDSYYGLLAVSRDNEGWYPFRITYNLSSKKLSIYSGTERSNLGSNYITLKKVEQYF